MSDGRDATGARGGIPKGDGAARVDSPRLAGRKDGRNLDCLLNGE